MKLLAITLLTLVSFAYAGTADLKVADVSTPDCPVRITGEVKLTQSHQGPNLYTVRSPMVDGVNVSNKVIVALVSRLVTTDFYGQPDIDNTEEDYFFQAEEFAPGTTKMIVHEEREGFPTKAWGEANGKPVEIGPETTEPTASAKVIFVQFADGTTWGKYAAAAAIFADRKGVYDSLLRFRSIYNQGGAAAFNAAIASQRFDNRSTRSMTRRMRQEVAEHGVEAAIARLDRALQAAKRYPELLK